MSSSDDSTDSCCDPYYVDMARLRKLDNLRMAIADGDYGLPLKCPCGERIVDEISPTETEKKRYLTCARYENDGLHRRKIWVNAIEEETMRLRKTVDTHIERMRDFSSHDFQIAQMKEALQEKDNQFAKLKEEVDQLKEAIQEKDNQFAKLKEEVDQLKEALQEKDNQFAKLMEEVDQLKEGDQLKDKEIAKLREEVDQLKEGDQLKDKEIAKLKDAVDDFGNRIRTLEHCCFD